VKRLILPALLALALHGLLLGIGLPRRQSQQARPAAIPVEIAIRQVEGQPAKTGKAPEQQRPQKPVPRKAPPRPKVEQKKPMPAKPKPVVRKKPTAGEKTALVPRPKESRIEAGKEKPPVVPAELPSTNTPPASPQPTAVTAGSSGQEEKAEPDAKSPAPAPIPAIERQRAIPAYQRNRQPEYPSRARRRGLSGTVMLRVLVDVTGRVAELGVERSSGYSSLDQAALKAVQQWLFSPATEDGVPVAMWVSVPITFRLQEP